MHPPDEDIVCENCGAHLSVDLDFCLECGADRRGQPSGSPPKAPTSGPAPVPQTLPPGAPPATMMPVVMNRGRLSLGLVLGVIGLILAIIAIASLSWFAGEDLEGDAGMRFGLKEVELKYEGGGQTSEQKESYKTLEAQMGGELTMDDVAGSTWWVLLVGLTLAGLFVLFALLTLIGVFRGSITLLPVLTGLVAGVLIVVAASYFGIAFQSALEEDFDVKLSELEDAKYGLGYSWYMALFGGILVLLGALLTYSRPGPSGQMYPMR